MGWKSIPCGNLILYEGQALAPVAFGGRLDRLKKCHRRATKFSAVAQDKSFGRHGVGLLKYDQRIGRDPALSPCAAQGLLP